MLQQVYEEPIVPVFIDHEQEVQAYYSRIEKITSQTPENVNYNQAPYTYPPYPDPYQYPASNYPQNYPGMPGPEPQYNANPYSFPNQYYGQAPAPHYTAASYGYPYPPNSYPQYGVASSYQPHPSFSSQGPPSQWTGESGAQTNLPYPYQSTTPINQSNMSAQYGWADIGLFLPTGPSQIRTDNFDDRTKVPGRSYAMEETIHASHAQRDFTESSSLIHDIGIGWKI